MRTLMPDNGKSNTALEPPEKIFSDAVLELGSRPSAMNYFKQTPKGLLICSTRSIQRIFVGVSMLVSAFITPLVIYIAFNAAGKSGNGFKSFPYLWPIIGAVILIDVMMAAVFFAGGRDVILDSMMSRIILKSPMPLIGRSREVPRGMIKCVRLAARPIWDQANEMLFYWDHVLETLDGKTVPLAIVRSLSSSAAFSDDLLKNPPRTAWVLARTLGVPVRFICGATDMNIDSLDDLRKIPASPAPGFPAAPRPSIKGDSRFKSTRIISFASSLTILIFAGVFVYLFLLQKESKSPAPDRSARVGQSSSLREDYEKCVGDINENPGDLKALECAAVNAWKLDMYQESFEYWQMMQESDPNAKVEDWESYCGSLLDVGERDLALQCRRKQIRLLPFGSEEAARVKEIILELENMPSSSVSPNQ